MPDEQRKSLSALSKKVGEVIGEKTKLANKCSAMELAHQEFQAKISDLELLKEKNSDKI